MNSSKIILALDPSGSFYEGKGTTGWCLFDTNQNKILTTGDICATKYPAMEQYWHQHCLLIEDMHKAYGSNLFVVMEDYLLYGDKVHSQINSRMETPKLIGLLQYFCWKEYIPYYMQTASEVKNRWTDAILEHKGYIKLEKRRYVVNTTGEPQLIHRHCRDAIRHAVHFSTFKIKE